MSLVSGSALRSVLARRDVRTLLGAGLVSQTGDWVLRTGIAYEIYALTGSTVASATALLASLAPQVALGSVAGAFVDRWDRRRTMIIVNVVLAVVLLPLLFVRDAGDVWLVYLVLAASSCLSPFFVAADATMLPALVEDPPARLTANALNSQVRDVARLVGAALGGVLAAAGGTVALALADMVTFALAAGLIAAIRHRPAPRTTPHTRVVRDWVEGFRTIRHDRTLMVILGFLAITGVGEAIMGALFAPFVHDLLGGSASTYGLILSSQAVGGVLGGALVTVSAHRYSPRVLFGWGSVLFGLIDLALFLSPLVTDSAWPAMVIIALVGLPGAAVGAGMVTALQTSTSDAVRGRVFGTTTAAHSATMLASTLVAGGAAEHFGILPVLVIQAVVYIVAGLVVVLVLHSGRSTVENVTSAQVPGGAHAQLRASSAPR